MIEGQMGLWPLSGAAIKEPQQQRTQNAEQQACNHGKIESRVPASPDHVARQSSQRQIELPDKNHRDAKQYENNAGSD